MEFIIFAEKNIMPWNHRILAFKTKRPSGKWKVHFEICEVTYAKNGKFKGYQNGLIMTWRSEKKLKWTIKKIALTFSYPVLWGGEKFPQEYKEDGK